MMKDANEALSSESSQMAQSVEKLRASIGSELEPAISALAKKMPELVEGFTSLIDFIKKHPELSLGALLAGTGGAGMAKGLANVTGRAAVDWIMGRAVNTVPGVGGKILGAGGKILGGAINAATATPVYVTNWNEAGGGGVGGGDKTPGGESAIASALGPAAALAAFVAALGYATIKTLEYTDSHEFRKSSMERHGDEAETEIWTSELAGLEASAADKRYRPKRQKSPVLDEFISGSKGSVAQAYGGASKMTPELARELGAVPIEKGQGSSGASGGNGHMDKFNKQLAEANKALDELTRKARNAGGHVSLLKSPPTYDRM